MATGTFSEHWHRVAARRVGLRPAVQIRKQYFRGEKWFLILDPLTNQFFRIDAGAHDFICRLDRRATVQEVWERCLTRDPDGAPGQEEVIQLLAQLHQANLLFGDVPAETGALLERHQKRRCREVRSLLNLMSLRIATFDPDRFLQRTLPAVRWLFSPLGALLWLVVVGWGLKVALDHGPALREQSEGVLAPANLPLLYCALVVIKTLHELGHAFSCRFFGGEVHRMGVMLLYFNPVPFVDATASWAFQSKWQRVFVASAGMLVEFFVAALAVFVWAATGEGAVHSVAYNMIFVASVTTLVFNANPLMRYDGYYILSDLLEIPNLAGRAQQMLQYLAERDLFGMKGLESPAATRTETWLLAIYGVASWLYRLVVFVSIALWISGRWLILGILLALGTVFSFTVLPLWEVTRYLAGPRLGRHRPRALLVTGGGAAILLLLLGFWPMASRFRAPGILHAEEYSLVFTSTPGVVREVLSGTGERVKQGQPLLRLESPELELELAAARAELARAMVEEGRALTRNAAELLPIRSRREVSEKRVRRIEEQQRGLVVTAAHDGRWVSQRIAQTVGQWFPRGQRIGELVQDSEFRFSAVISEEEAANLFSGGGIRDSEVRIRGQAAKPLHVTAVRIIPAQQEMLPSAALGWAAGGEIATSQSDPHGLRALEPFFELRATLQPRADVEFLHGRSGSIRVELAREPLLGQWYRKLRQLLQRKYQV